MTAATSTPAAGLARSVWLRSAGFILALALLAVVSLLSVFIGARDMSPGTIMNAIFAFDGSTEHIIVWELRVPRTVVGLIVGPALGVCGALIQAFTRNPLADPGILGVNAGAGFAVTLAIGFFGLSSASQYVWFAMIGAAAVTVIVYIIGSTGPDKATPAKLTLAGVALSAVLGGVGSAIALKNPQLFDGMRFWGVGSLSGRSMEVVAQIAPFIVVGLIIALAVARPLNALALGDDLGRSLGVKIGSTRVLVIISVTLLAGAATAIAGPIAFVGLMVPHAVRWFTGPDQRWVIPYSMVVAALLLLISDILGRVLLPTGELRVGLVTALVGAPVLIALARRKTASGL
ncbi:FecCD family ABC transporter permease [Mycetocola spongiae]|uniref:FecCD family ABC transporter permease n=1 Tax=Mycetocola spongiae TaxID=2859226 RepID=UPI001CF5FD0D|nr:iron chelate uptake ABC transporter family permease subunit [Mycetocola spongiae]UCR89384.1 iron chelate uptake ABC transporter family permease subunit [Mycetocola spongiae]